MTGRVLIAGVSARGMAESAVRAGYAVIAVDAFADLDLAAIADTRLVSPYSARVAAATARRAAARETDGSLRHNGAMLDAVCYVSNFENHPGALRQLSRGQTLWGNAPAAVAAARAPAAWAQALENAGIAVPRVRMSAPKPGTADGRRRWLLKPKRSGGGHGVQAWRPGIPVPREYVLQERIAGTPGSVVFAADGRNAAIIAITRQLIGEAPLGAPAFRYCGNILAPPGDPEWGDGTPLWHEAAAIAAAASRAFGLAGVNGIDFIVRRGHPVPIEINPRFTAAMELAERRDGISIFGAHVAGCTGTLRTGSPLRQPARGVGASGKAIVFARYALTVGTAAHTWVSSRDVRDIPRPGSQIPAGAPICSIFAEAGTATACRTELIRAARRIYKTVATDVPSSDAGSRGRR
jgi:predicted ATP-grasp superfamily ATP-dependent carboligase